MMRIRISMACRLSDSIVTVDVSLLFFLFRPVFLTGSAIRPAFRCPFNDFDLSTVKVVEFGHF